MKHFQEQRQTLDGKVHRVFGWLDRGFVHKSEPDILAQVKQVRSALN